jgi:hypothetical protein
MIIIYRRFTSTVSYFHHESEMGDEEEEEYVDEDAISKGRIRHAF